MGRPPRQASDKKSAEGSKDPTPPADRLNRLEQRVLDLEKRVFELEQTSSESTSQP
jgi:hypothetical protein